MTIRRRRRDDCAINAENDHHADRSRNHAVSRAGLCCAAELARAGRPAAEDAGRSGPADRGQSACRARRHVHAERTGPRRAGTEGDRVWLDHAAMPEVLDMVGQVIGPDFLLWGTTVFGKPAHSGKETPWHQDGEYWPIRPLATCSVWIAMDAATKENGCLRVIPGSRDKRLMGHDTNNSDGLTPEPAAETRKNTVRRTPTISNWSRARSRCTTSTWCMARSRTVRPTAAQAMCCASCRPRRTSTANWAPRSTKKTGGQVDFVTRPLYLMRGGDVCGKNDIGEVLA